MYEDGIEILASQRFDVKGESFNYKLINAVEKMVCARSNPIAPCVLQKNEIIGFKVFMGKWKG